MAADYNRYEHKSPAEIITLLTKVVRSRTPLLIQSERDSFSATINAVHLAEPSLTITCDATPQRVVNSLQSENLVFSANSGPARLEFVVAARGIRPTIDNAIVVSLPTHMLRFDRRERYRVALTKDEPARCELPIAGAPAIMCDAFDLSAGGIGLIMFGETSGIAGGDIVRGCRLQLPRVGVLSIDMEMRHKVEDSLPDGSKFARLGYRFVNLSAADQNAIHRFITEIEILQNPDSPSLEFV